MLKYLTEKVNKDLSFVKAEIKILMDKKLTAYFTIALEIMLYKPNLFLNEIFEIVSNEILLEKGQYRENYFSWQVRQLLQETFSLYSIKQKNTIINKILQIRNKDEKAVIRKNNKGEKKVINFIGFYKQVLMSSIPSHELNYYPTFKRHLQEYGRRYGIFINKKPSESPIISRSGYPSLNIKAYQEMSLKQWKKSFYKYNTQERSPFDNKVTLEGNAEQFHNAIKENPKKFMPLVLEVINDDFVHIEYKIKAVRALISVEYDVNVVELLFKFINLNDNFEQTYFITEVYEYFFRKEHYNESLFEILTDYAKERVDIAKEDINNFSVGNHKQGVGIRLLLKYGNNKKYSERTFTLIENIVEQNTPFIKLAIVGYLAYLNNYDKERALHIFVSLTKELDNELLQISIFSLQYMIHVNFKKLIPFFKVAINMFDEREQDKKTTYSSVVEILLSAWLNDYSSAEKLFFKAFSKVNKEDIEKLTRTCLKSIGENEKYREKSELFLKSIMDRDDNTDKIWFSDLKVTQFDKNYSLLEYFTLSPAAKGRNSSFYRYLGSCVKDENSALKCLKLLSNTSKKELINNYESVFLRAESVEVVIKCYNTIRNHSKNEKLINFALDVFDEELKRTNNQSEIDRVLELV